MEWLRRVRFLLNRRQREQDIDEEMRLHIALRAEEHQAEGVPADEAARAAQRRFGNTTLHREEGAETWGWAWLDSFTQDMRYGFRSLRKQPSFTAVAVLSLALGIGANTAIFSILNALMLRTLPVKDPSRLVLLRSDEMRVVTNPLWEAIRDHHSTFDGVTAFGQIELDLAEGGESHLAKGMWVSGDFFQVLGVSAWRGRLIDQSDDQPRGGKAGPVAVISHAFWMSQYNGDPGIIGKTIKLERHPFTIVGVTPPWFIGTQVDQRFQVAIPVGCEPIIHTDRSALGERSWWWLQIMARLKPGQTIAQAEAQFAGVAGEINRLSVPTHWDSKGQSEFMKRPYQLDSAATGFSNARVYYKRALFVLMAVVGLVLVIACANVANLLLARATARHREISVRMAIGAGRTRVIRQLLTESFLLALAGTVGGLLFAQWGSRVLVSWFSTQRNQMQLDLQPDLTVLGFTCAIMLLTTLLFGLVPAFRASAVETNEVLKDSTRNSAAGSNRFNLGKALVAVQVALSLTLLVGAGLYLRTIQNFLSIPTGFDASNLMVMEVRTESKVEPSARNVFYTQILEELRATRGVRSAAALLIRPIGGAMWNERFWVAGFTPKSDTDAVCNMNAISPGYFHTMRTPLIAGRDFSPSDTETSERVIIVTQQTAQHYFGAASPLGQTIEIALAGQEKVAFRVVGVVGNSKYFGLVEKNSRIAYIPFPQQHRPSSSMQFALRYDGDPKEVLDAGRTVVSTLNSSVSLQFTDFQRQIEESLLQQTIVARLSAFFGGLALLLAMIGLYGVTAYAVVRRQAEIGIRMALGARRDQVMRLVLNDVFLLLAAGIVAGTALALVLGRLIRSMLYGIEPADVGNLFVAAAVLAVATIAAGWIPARRAARMDPTTALREQ